MPSISALRRSRILERFVLQALRRQAYVITVREEAFTIGGHHMRHHAAAPDMSMKPESAFHRVDHTIAAVREFGSIKNSFGVVGHRRQSYAAVY